MTPTRRNAILAIIVFAVASAGVFFVLKPSGVIAGLTSPVDSPFMAPSGVEYPALYTPENVRSQMYIWQLDGVDLEDLDEDKRQRATLDLKWEQSARLVGLDIGADELARRWQESVHDPHTLLDSAGRQRILTHIAQHTIARSQPTPEMYTRLVDADRNLEWSGDLSSVAKIRIFYDFFLERPADYTLGTRQILEEAWTGLRTHQHLFDEAGYGPDGALFVVKRIRSASLLRTMLRGPDAPADVTNWITAAASGPMQFVTPTRTVEDALNEHGSVIALHARILIRLEDSRLGVWDPTWFLHPETNEWVLVSMGARTVKTFMTIM